MGNSVSRSGLVAAACLLALVGCGGGGGSSQTPTSPGPGPSVPPPPPPPPPPPVIGNTGGTVTDATGAAIVFPEGAVESDTTFRIAVDSTGAPTVPAEMGGVGNIYMVTPHGGQFLDDVEVRIPAPSVTLEPNQAFKLAKAEPGGEWAVLDETEVVDGKLSTQVRDFSYFMGVVVTYVGPILQVAPLSYTSTLTCNGGACDQVYGQVAITYTAVGNNGQRPQGCASDDSLRIESDFGGGAAITTAGGTYSSTQVHNSQADWRFRVALRCPGYVYEYAQQQLTWLRRIRLPDMAILRFPEQLDVVEGASNSLEAVIAGTLMEPPSSRVVVPTELRRAVIEWQRSDDNGTSWRHVATSYQNEANPQPSPGGVPWVPWSVSHGFVATAGDHGALLRVRSCYSPPVSTEPPNCVVSRNARINVLQQTALPGIVEQPRSVLIRSGETANFSVSVAGVPAPTLRWQTRPANSTGAWSDVTDGTGGASTQYTTAPRALSHNGVQYRVVATNALASVASAPVTVSVSDLDVGPSFTTQPASLTVVSGGDAVFAAAVHGTESLSYQWRFNNVNIPGANSPILRLASVTNANAGSYVLFASNAVGSVASNAATLTVTAGTPAAVAPSIVTQPVSVVANVGNTATFAVGVDGTGPLSFQWRRDGVNMPGANAAVLTFASVALPNAGSYSVVVSNSAGSVTSQAVTLDVQAAVATTPPSITSQPSTVIVAAGGSALLAVGATGSGPLAYQWSFNGTTIPGATLPVLSLTNVGNAQVGDYTVAITNDAGTVTSQVAQLILLGAPVITQQPVAVSVAEGATATFSVTATGSGLHFQWMRDGVQIPGASSATYTTPVLVQADAGAVYSVLIYNGAGLVTSSGAVLTVTAAPTLTGTTLASPAHGGGPSNHTANNPSLSADGRYVAFRSFATNLIAGFPQPPMGMESNHAFRRDLVAGTTVLINQTTSGGVSTHGVENLRLSANGRYAVFSSQAADLVPGDTNGAYDVFRRDIQTGTTERLSLLPGGAQIENGGNASGDLKLSISGDGEYVSFLCSHDVATGGTGQDIGYRLYVRHVPTGNTRMVDLTQPPFQVQYVAMSDNGWLAYETHSSATNSILVMLHDVAANSYVETYSYVQGAFPSGSRAGLSVSADGRYVVFALNEVGITGTTYDQVLIADRLNPLTGSVVSTGPDGLGNGSSTWPRISGDGRYVLFETTAPNLTGGLANALRRYPVIRDRVAGATIAATHRTNGTPVFVEGSGNTTLSSNGETVAFVGDNSEVTGGPFLSQIFVDPRR